MRRVVGLTVFAVAVYGIWLFMSDLAGITVAVGKVGPASLMLAIAYAAANYLIRWLRWQHYLSVLGLRVAAGESAVVFLAGFAMTLTPAKMGEVLKSLLLRQTHDIPIATTAPIVVAERVTDLAGLVLLAALGCAALPGGHLSGAAGAIAVVALMVACSVRRCGLWIVGIATRLPFASRKADRLRHAYEELHRISRARTTLLATALSTVAWATHCLCLWHCAACIAPGCIEALESCIAYAAPLLGGTLLLIPGGLGATELSMTGLLVALSEQRIDTTTGTAIALLVRLVTFWFAIVLGILALAYWNRRHGKVGTGGHQPG